MLSNKLSTAMDVYSDIMLDKPYETIINGACGGCFISKFQIFVQFFKLTQIVKKKNNKTTKKRNVQYVYHFRE